MATKILKPKITTNLGYPCCAASISGTANQFTVAQAVITAKDINGGLCTLSDLIGIGSGLQTKALKNLESNKLSLKIASGNSSIAFTGLINGVTVTGDSANEGLKFAVQAIHQDVLLDAFDPSVYMRESSKDVLKKVRKDVIKALAKYELSKNICCSWVALMDQGKDLSVSARIAALLTAAMNYFTEAGGIGKKDIDKKLAQNKEISEEVMKLLKDSNKTSKLPFTVSDNTQNMLINNSIASKLFFSAGSFFSALQNILSDFSMVYACELTGSKHGVIITPEFSPDGNDSQSVSGDVFGVQVNTTSQTYNSTPISQYSIAVNNSYTSDGKLDSSLGKTVTVSYPESPTGKGPCITAEAPGYITLVSVNLKEAYSNLPQSCKNLVNQRTSVKIGSAQGEVAAKIKEKNNSVLNALAKMAKEGYYMQLLYNSTANIQMNISLDSKVLMGKKTNIVAKNGGMLASGVLKGIQHTASPSGLVTSAYISGALLANASV